MIIGAGASAAAFAWSIADKKMRVVCLEQGGWVNTDDYPANGMDWESRPDFSSDPNIRRAQADYPIDNSESDIAVANFNGVGGGTILYAAHFPRFHPADFRVKTLDGVAEDWPITYEALEPYYALNDRMMGVAAMTGDPAYPEKPAVMPPIPLGQSGEVLAKGYNALGWHWWPADCAIATEEYEGRAPCINLGACGLGCVQGAKASVDVTYWPAAIRAGVELRTHCRVRDITVTPDGRAGGAIYFDDDGAEREIRAHLVILACNGIGTPRLLLNSKSSLFPDGLANSSGQVGRNLMFHPYAGVDGVFDEDLDGNRGPHKAIWSHEFCETDRSRGFTRGFSFETHRGYGAVGTALVGLQSGAIPWGDGFHSAYSGLADHVMSVIAVCEDLPNENNRVTLDDSLTDSHGIPAPKITYRLDTNSLAMLEYAKDRAEEVLLAAGAKRLLRKFSPVPQAGWHNLGTARMGSDPSRSVVNAWGRAHDVPNLFVIDGSLFVTSSSVNPTSTIQALALYIADRIKQKLDDGSLFE